MGGESGSGKTEIAHLTAIGLKSKNMYAKILHTDNYYKVSQIEGNVAALNNLEFNSDELSKIDLILEG